MALFFLFAGTGQLIDTALFATMLALQSGILFFGADPPPFAIHEVAPYIPTYRAYLDSEGQHFTVAALSAEQWRRLCQVAGVAELGADPRFDSLLKRVNNAEELIPLLQQQFAARPRAHWIAALNAQQIPSGPVYSHEDLRREPRVQEMNLLLTMQHPVAGAIQSVGLPVVFHDSPASIRLPSSLHGQHTEDILRQYGYSAEKIQALKSAGARPGRLPFRLSPTLASPPEWPGRRYVRGHR